MNEELYRLGHTIQRSYHQKQPKTISLFPGIDLAYLSFQAESFSVQHKPLDHVLQINYCKTGRLGWRTKKGNDSYLGPGNFSIHGMDICDDSVMLFPTGEYEGLLISIDLHETVKNQPEILEGTEILEKILPEKYCKDKEILTFVGDSNTESIFCGFYGRGSPLWMAKMRIKALELLTLLAEMPISNRAQLHDYRSEQVLAVREVHEYLLSHINERVTIEDLSKQYHINPTTLKSTFKSVYGMSIAAHIKAHRMETAAKLLMGTDRSIAQIAQAVGYDSQSKFSTAFKSFFNVLPKDFRKQESGTSIAVLRAED